MPRCKQIKDSIGQIKALYRKWKHRLYANIFVENIYEKHLQNFLDQSLLPYESIDSLKRGLISPVLKRQIEIKNGLLCLNFLRFLLILLLSPNDTLLRPYLCEYFHSSKYNYPFHFVCLSTFLTPTFLSKCSFPFIHEYWFSFLL